jgi:hypothetical protein
MEKETVKLVNVMRRIARAANYAAWTNSTPETNQFCVEQYNRVLARLTELEPSLGPLFTPLASDASPEVTRIAAREVLAYFEADLPEVGWRFERPAFRGCHPRKARVRCVPVSVTCD